jgi:hypothetical protein
MLAAERRWGSAMGSLPDTSIVAPPRASGGVVSREICALSGLAANDWCPVRKLEWIGAESELLPCSWHHLDDGNLITIWPAEYRHWAAEHRQSSGFANASPKTRAAQTRGAAATFRIASPADGSTFLIDPTLRREFQAVPLRAVSSSAGEVVWEVDGQAVRHASPERVPSWPLAPGRHTFVARDPSGHIAKSTIVVR